MRLDSSAGGASLSLSLSARGAVAAFPSLAASPRESLPSAAQAGRLAAHPAK